MLQHCVHYLYFCSYKKFFFLKWSGVEAFQSHKLPAFWCDALYSSHKPPTDVLGWTLCCSHRHATQISKRADKGSTNRAQLQPRHLLNWNVKRTLVDQVDMATHGSDASETMYRRGLQVCITTKQTPLTVWFAWQQKMLLRFMGQIILLIAEGHLGTRNWSLWILMRHLGVGFLNSQQVLMWI